MEYSLEDVLAVFRGSGSKGLKVKDLAHRLGAKPKDVKRLRSVVEDLETRGKLLRGRRRRYQLVEEAGYLAGTIIGYGTEAATLFPSDGSPGMRVPGENLSGAVHGDSVVARVVRDQDGETVAQVVRVVERGGDAVIGQVCGWRDRPGVGPFYGRMKGAARGGVPGDTLVTVGQEDLEKNVVVGKVDARPGDYVVVRVRDWGEGYESARGRVTEVLGGPATPGEDFASVAREFNLPLSFPQEVLDAADAIPETIPAEERSRREDLTGLLTFTIDPADAKDFDDAISLEPAGSGLVRVGVHIADVAHYVREGSALDREALARGNSVYLVDRVIPMLPSRLSSDLAALRAGVVRLAVSVLMDVDRYGEVKSYRIVNSFIRSAARLSYDDAQTLLDEGPAKGAGAEARAIAEVLRRANDLREVLRAKRIKRGAIELETSEMDIVVDADGNAVDIKPVKRHGTHNLIEELMILANETVANHMSYLGRLFIYRVHEVPDEEAMKDLALFASTFGHRFRWTRGTSPAALEALLARVKGKPEYPIIAMFLLRSLKKAVYSERNVGHFGLASKCYTHFTSPIRRYPDLVVHRLLKTYGFRRRMPDDEKALHKFVHEAAEIASIREVEGDGAERAFIKVKVAEYMEKRIGEEYWGVISGVKDFGLFVMLEDNLVEGLVHVSCLGDDYYRLDSTKTMLVGSRGKSCYRMGDRVKVKVVRADRRAREVDFLLIARERFQGAVAHVDETMSRSRARRMYNELREETQRGRSAGRRRGAPPSRRGGRAKQERRVARSSKPARLRRMKLKRSGRGK